MRVGPLWQHMFPPSVAPTLAFVGLAWKSIRNQQFELQVCCTFFMHVTALCNKAQHSMSPRGTASTAYHSTAQHSTAQHSTAQLSIAQRSFLLPLNLPHPSLPSLPAPLPFHGRLPAHHPHLPRQLLLLLLLLSDAVAMVQAKLVARALSGRAILPSQKQMLQDIADFYQLLKDSGVPVRYTHNQVTHRPR